MHGGILLVDELDIAFKGSANNMAYPARFGGDISEEGVYKRAITAVVGTVELANIRVVGVDCLGAFPRVP